MVEPKQIELSQNGKKILLPFPGIFSPGDGGKIKYFAHNINLEVDQSYDTIVGMMENHGDKGYIIRP